MPEKPPLLGVPVSLSPTRTPLLVHEPPIRMLEVDGDGGVVVRQETPQGPGPASVVAHGRFPRRGRATCRQRADSRMHMMLRCDVYTTVRLTAADLRRRCESLRQQLQRLGQEPWPAVGGGSKAHPSDNASNGSACRIASPKHVICPHVSTSCRLSERLGLGEQSGGAISSSSDDPPTSASTAAAEGMPQRRSRTARHCCIKESFACHVDHAKGAVYDS